ncbi:hypothetical protein K504DRAFT_461000 [Pleomassaria siparia CBS 279.74]|uniref:Uncharacterized protein n=1 Tax=Pleomassaria siparia CBS 279.74 TaxID=1314801 RepID=A0A6G1JVV0_9PLEO|nr:hypothetical protein K504DRAFT_461000 [Pleomassaria siparia CBS 279.74]
MAFPWPEWLSFFFFATIPLWADIAPSDLGGVAILVAIRGLDTFTQFGYPQAHASFDAKLRWIRIWALDFATCSLACKLFSNVQGLRWAVLYFTLVARWANPVLQAQGDMITPIIETYRFKYEEPERTLHLPPIVAMVTLATLAFRADKVRGLQLTAIWFHFFFSISKFGLAAWTYSRLTEEQKKAVGTLQEEKVVNGDKVK